MIQNTQALTAAHDAVAKKHPDRKIGNIVVEPAKEHFQVLLVDAPHRSQETKPVMAFRARVERKTGKVAETGEIKLEASPYKTTRVPDAMISGKQAFDHALAALKGFENYGKEGKLTVELVGEIYRVTFPLPEEQKTSRGPDYAYQIWVHYLTGEVVKTLVAS